MGNEDLFARISCELGLTNIFVGFKMEPKDSLPKDLVSKPEIHNERFPARVKLTTFQISHPHNGFSTGQKMIQNNNPVLATPLPRPPSVSGRDIYTPSSMEMSTPYISRNYWSSRQRSISGSSFNDIMVETPCQKSNDEIQNIETTFQRMELGSIQKVWFYCNSALKGFRDPQIQSSDA